MMRDSRPYLINILLHDSAENGLMSLLKIYQRTILLLNINRKVNELLPTVLRPCCRVVNMRNGILVLETSTASWQMRLRYEQPKLLSALRKQILPSLSSVYIRINPSLAKIPEFNLQKNSNNYKSDRLIVTHPRRLSVKSAAFIRCVAERSEGKLSKALERLAKLSGDSFNQASKKNRY